MRINKSHLSVALTMAAVVFAGAPPAEAKRLIRGSVGHWVHKNVNPTVTPIARSIPIAAGVAIGAPAGLAGKAAGMCAGKYVNARFAGKKKTDCSKAGLL